MKLILWNQVCFEIQYHDESVKILSDVLDCCWFRRQHQKHIHTEILEMLTYNTYVSASLYKNSSHAYITRNLTKCKITIIEEIFSPCHHFYWEWLDYFKDSNFLMTDTIKKHAHIISINQVHILIKTEVWFYEHVI